MFRGGSSDQKIEIGFIIRDVKLSFLEICSNFHDVVATPNVYVVHGIIFLKMNEDYFFHFVKTVYSKKEKMHFQLISQNKFYGIVSI